MSDLLVAHCRKCGKTVDVKVLQTTRLCSCGGAYDVVDTRRLTKASPGAGERRAGFWRQDVERVMRHYGVSYAEAIKGMKEGRYPLPTRGAGLTQKGAATTSGAGEVAVAALLIIVPILLGLGMIFFKQRIVGYKIVS